MKLFLSILLLFIFLVAFWKAFVTHPAIAIFLFIAILIVIQVKKESQNR